MGISGVDTGLVTGRFIVGLVDGADTEDEPDLIGAKGTFEFVPAVNYVPVPLGEPGPFTLLKDPIIGVLDAEGYICTPNPLMPNQPGKRGLRLFATDSKDASVVGWTWRVTPKFVNAFGVPIASYIPPFDLAVSTGKTVDLATVVKVPQSTGVGTEQVVAYAATAIASARQAAEAAEYAAEEASSAGISAWEATELAAQAKEIAEGVAKLSAEGAFVPKISVGTVTTLANPADDVWMADIVRNSPEVSAAFKEIFPTSMQGPKGDAGGWGNGSVLSTSTDINTIRAPGLYTNATAVTTAQNYPLSGAAGILRVYTVANNSALYHQDWVANPHTSAIDRWARGYYTRMCNSGTWSPWRFISTQRVDNTAGRTIYTWDDTANKEQLIFGDTGNRQISDLIDTTKWTIQVAKMRRYGANVELRLQLSPLAGHTGQVTVFEGRGLPAGFRNQHTIQGAAGNGPVLRAYRIEYSGTQMTAMDIVAGSGITLVASWLTNDPWPTTLPGTADGTVSYS